MGFLSGWFIAGIAAVSAPIIFHMIRRTPSGKVPFSTLMFLEASPPRMTRRSRIDHWPLLLLRALALILLALGFARPFLRSAETHTTAVAPGQQLAIVLDTSASMRRAGMWDAAKFSAIDAVASATQADQVAIYAFDRSVSPVLSFAEWDELAPSVRRDVVVERLEALRPGWAATNLGQALVTAADELESLEMTRDDKSSGEVRRSVLLISDTQQGAALEALQNYEWPESVTVRVDTIVADAPTNAGLEVMSQSAQREREVRLRVTNAADSASEEFRVQWHSEDGKQLGPPRPVYVAPGRSRTVSFQTPPGIGSAHAVLSGDAHDFDNTVYVDRLAAAELTVLWLGDGAEDDPESLRFYFSRAFPDTPGRHVRLVDATAPLDRGTSLVVVADRVPAAAAGALKAWLESGGTVLFVAQSAEGVASLSAVLPTAPQATETQVDTYSMMTDIDYTHPLFAPFADAAFADFTRIHFWKYRQLKVDNSQRSRVVARFDSGDPAVMEIASGRGRVLILASGWHPTDSQLSVSSRYVPLMNALLEHASQAPTALPRMTVGDELPLDQFRRGSSAAERVEITLPDGSITQLAEDVTVFTGTSVPGVYQVNCGDVSARFAVNVDPAETRTTEMALEQLEGLGVRTETTPSDAESLAAAAADRERQLKVQELERQQKLWRWLVLAAFGVLLVETWLAGRLALKHQHAVNPGGTT